MSKRKTSRRRRVVHRAKAAYHKRVGIVGGLSLKGIIMGAAMLTVGKIAVGTFAPGIPFQGPLGAVAGGALAGATGLPGKALIGYGIMDAGSSVLASLVGGGGFGLKTGGGYEF